MPTLMFHIPLENTDLCQLLLWTIFHVVLRIICHQIGIKKNCCVWVSQLSQQPCVILPMIALTGSVVKRWQKYVEKGRGQRKYKRKVNNYPITFRGRHQHTQSILQHCNYRAAREHKSKKEKSFSITVETSISDNDVNDIMYYFFSYFKNRDPL